MNVGRGGRLIVLTGPPGSGKTTTALMWAVTRDRPTYPLDWDAVRSSLLAVRRLGHDCLPSDVSDQYRLAAQVVSAEAERITAAGNDCIVVCAWVLNMPPPYDVWEPLARLRPLVAVLLPDAETCLRRSASDPARQGAFAVPEEHVRWSLDLPWAAWHGVPGATVVDNSSLTLDQTIVALEAAVQAASTSG